MISEKEFIEVYEKYHEKVYRLCMGYFKGNTSIAKDATQQVFINVWEKRKSFRREAAIATWVYRIAVNTCLLFLRKNGKTISFSDMKIPDTYEEANIAEEKEQQLQSLYACINKLNEVNRVIILMVLDGLDYEHIAEVTGISYDSLRVRIHRIKKQLTNCVHHE